MAAPTKPSPVVVTQPAAAGEPPLSVVETPTSPSSAFALARFEFETDKGNEGTKIVMVEWDGSASPAATKGAEKKDIRDWQVSWEGKTHVLQIRDADTDDGSTRRVFFLLPPGAHVPALVNISRRSGGSVLRAKPLPAIYPAELGAANKEAGRRGVLHTIWAKKRISELEAEIAVEMKNNSESVGLQMAIQERDWIMDEFGVGDAADSAKRSYPLTPQGPTSPTSPRSPIGGKLGEKLRGLKLATSPQELAAAQQASKTRVITTLSPSAGDVAVSSFATFAARAGGKGNSEPVASLDAVMDGGRVKTGKEEAPDTEEELFALPLSPRSPEMAKSPFSLL